MYMYVHNHSKEHFVAIFMGCISQNCYNPKCSTRIFFRLLKFPLILEGLLWLSICPLLPNWLLNINEYILFINISKWKWFYLWKVLRILQKSVLKHCSGFKIIPGLSLQWVSIGQATYINHFLSSFVSFYSFNCTFAIWQTTCVNFTTVTFASFSPVGILDFVVVVLHFVVESFRLWKLQK